MAAEVESPEVALPASLDGLQAQIAQSSHLLASTGQAELSALALQATKDIFELGLSNEPRSHPHLHPFLVSILQPPSISLRSKSKAKTEAAGADEDDETAEEADPTEVLPYTPLTELTTSGLDHEQIWAQLELRADGIVKVVKEVGPGDQPDLDNSDIDVGSDEEDDEDEDEDDSGEEMTEEEWERMMQEHGRGDDSDSDEGDDVEEDSDEDEDEDEEGESDDEENMIRWKDEDGEEGSASGSGSGSEDDEDEGSEDEDDEDVSDELGSDEDIDMDALGSDEEAEEDEDDDKAALFGAGDENDDDDDMPGPSSRRKRHPTLDDDFFSIDEFNRLTEEAEAGRLSSGRLGGEEDEDEDDLGDVGAVMLQAGPSDDDDIMYNDFFDTPRELRRAGKPPGRKDDGGRGKGKGKGKEQDKKGKGKGKGVSFGEDEEMSVDAEDEDEDAAGEGREVIGRFKGDLFDSDDEDDGEGGQKTLSTHEKQQLELAKQIAELEGQAIGPKDWTLLGEATSRARPENSLLEEDLDFEQVAKVVPVITEERVQSLEDMIKKRIIDNNFDSTVRVRAYEPTAFLPSRYLELQDTQSTKSLAQIYEDEYTAAASGTTAADPRDEKLKKEHEEIERIWGEVCYKLDALSSLNFVPKAPKAQITTVENLPTTSLESALPPSAAATTLLAPEEMFAPPTARDLVARSEQTPEEAHAARGKRRREKKAERAKLGDMAELYGKKRPRGGVKGEKERALAGLVKTGKGVTVLGKGEKERGKAAKRAAGAAGTEDREGGKRLKL